MTAQPAPTSQTAAASLKKPQGSGTEGFDRLLSGVALTSLNEGPVIELPMVHPMTGVATITNMKLCIFSTEQYFNTVFEARDSTMYPHSQIISG